MKFGTLKVVTNRSFFRYSAKPEKRQFPWKPLFIKGALSRGFLRFEVKWNAFKRTPNTPRQSREGNLLISQRKNKTKSVTGDFFTKQGKT